MTDGMGWNALEITFFSQDFSAFLSFLNMYIKKEFLTLRKNHFVVILPYNKKIKIKIKII